jgi:NADPH-dependent glutamate synthase beta subunit-like oxidoreductase
MSALLLVRTGFTSFALSFTRSFSSLRCAIVGSGPSSFYCAKYLLKSSPTATVDIYEKLPVPFGLVRFGVAPDHPEVKLVTKEFQSVLDDPRVKFRGNVEIGKQTNERSVSVSLQALHQRYHSIILAYGAQSERSLFLSAPSSYHPPLIPSRRFVNWYNGHPDYTKDSYQFNSREAIIIGQGNVALDIARILLQNPKRLESSDISSPAIKALRESKIQRVHLIGRRGAVQAAFTLAELRELSTLPGIRIEIRPDEIEESLTFGSLEELKTRPNKRKMELIQELANKWQAGTWESGKHQRDKEEKGEKILSLRFLLAPLRWIPRSANGGIQWDMEFERTALTGEANNQNAIGTGLTERIEAGIAFSSIGYQASPIEDEVPFDRKLNVVPSVSGRVINDSHSTIPGLYVTGWLKRGPSGIIGSNIPDAIETVNSFIDDWNNYSHPIHQTQLV